ncbi:MAG TPA: DUF6785 family protein [Planctomycetota bacterium]|nr:DUF6785 family protein [Planctomycetota bacterium]
MPAEPQHPQVPESRAGSLTLRAAVIGIFCVLGIAVAGSISAMLRYDLIGTGHLPRCALYPVVLIMGLNYALKRFFRKRGLSTIEMLFIYCTILIMTGIPGQQFAEYMYLGLVGPFYHATPENQYASAEHGFTRYISDWLVPSKDPNHPVIRWMFEGLPPGAGFTDIPWGMWVRPLLVWMPFTIGVFFVTMCITVLLRKQWVERERLFFPLAQVPLEAAKTDSAGGPGPVYKSKLMWIGFAIPAFVFLVNGLHAYFPAVPSFNLYYWPNLFAEKPWYVLNALSTHVYFGMIGIAFLLTAEVSFSFWFFYIFDLVQQMVRISMGAPRPWGFRRDQHIGAFITVAAFFAWVGRRHIRDILRNAFGRGERVDDSDEPVSYRFAFFGAVIGFLLICSWCTIFGISFIFPVVMFGWYFLSLIVITRVIAEAGLFVYWMGCWPGDFALSWAGYDNVSDRNMTMIQFIMFHRSDSAANLMPQSLQALKIATEAKMDKRKVFAMMLAAMVIAIFACHVPSLYMIYKHGSPNLGWLTRMVAAWPGQQIQSGLTSKEQFTGGDVGEMLLGAGFTAFLLLMRRQFLWWPFHPLGYVANTTWMFWRYWFSIFVGWLMKVTVTWLGGVKLYRRVYPFAIGLIVGETVILFSWLLFHFIYPIKGVLIIE